MNFGSGFLGGIAAVLFLIILYCVWAFLIVPKNNRPSGISASDILTEADGRKYVIDQWGRKVYLTAEFIQGTKPNN